YLSIYAHVARLTLLPFPTRRSSDLPDSSITAIFPFRLMTTQSPSLFFTAIALLGRSVFFLESKLKYCTVPACFASNVVWVVMSRSEEHTSELQSRSDLVCRLLLEKK